MNGTSQGKHVLYVAWGFPPHRGPGTYRSLATVNMLTRAGHRVTVITADLATFDIVVGADHSLIDRVDPRIRVIRVPFPAGRRDPIVSRWSATRVGAAREWRAEVSARELATFPELTYALWRPRLDAAAYRLHRADPVDLVISTGNPYVDFAPAFLLGTRFGVPYVLDDRDAWLLDVYTGEPLDPAGPAEDLCEAMMRRSASSWFVNEPIADWYRARFPAVADRIRVVENGWDEEYVGPARAPRTADPHRPVFGFLGTISRGLPVEELLEGWRRARPRLGEHAELHFYGQIGHAGGGDPERLRLFADHHQHGVRYQGRCPKTEVARAYGTMDALVFAKEGGALVTSGKVYEYVATGKPIVCAVAPDHDARRVLSSYPRRHDSDTLSAADLAEAFVAAWADVRTVTPQVTRAAHEAGDSLRRERLVGAALDDVLATVGTAAPVAGTLL